MRTIPLSQNKVAIVDDDDYESLSRFKWHAYKHGMNWYAARNAKNEQGLRRPIRMHREVMGFPPSEIDHANGDGLDNRRSNLRLATRSQNVANGRTRRTNKCGVKGTSYIANLGKWAARIMVHGKTIDLGLFYSAAEAHCAYMVAAKKYFGEFARDN